MCQALLFRIPGIELWTRQIVALMYRTATYVLVAKWLHLSLLCWDSSCSAISHVLSLPFQLYLLIREPLLAEGPSLCEREALEYAAHEIGIILGSNFSQFSSGSNAALERHRAGMQLRVLLGLFDLGEFLNLFGSQFTLVVLVRIRSGVLLASAMESGMRESLENRGCPCSLPTHPLESLLNFPFCEYISSMPDSWHVSSSLHSTLRGCRGDSGRFETLWLGEIYIYNIFLIHWPFCPGFLCAAQDFMVWTDCWWQRRPHPGLLINLLRRGMESLSPSHPAGGMLDFWVPCLAQPDLCKGAVLPLDGK